MLQRRLSDQKISVARSEKVIVHGSTVLRIRLRLNLSPYGNSSAPVEISAPEPESRSNQFFWTTSHGSSAPFDMSRKRRPDSFSGRRCLNMTIPIVTGIPVIPWGTESTTTAPLFHNHYYRGLTGFPARGQCIRDAKLANYMYHIGAG